VRITLVAEEMNWDIREKRPAFTFRTGAVYEGEWLKGHRDGFGVQIWPDGGRYEGKYLKESLK